MFAYYYFTLKFMEYFLKILSQCKKKSWAIVFLCACIGLLIAYICLANMRDANGTTFTQLESAFFQVFIFVFGLIGSYLFGISSTNKNLNIHAKPAFRRVLTLYKSYSSILNVIGDNECSDKEKIKRIELVTLFQIQQADDVVNDWRDIVPEEVDKILSDAKNIQKDNL